MKRHAWRVILLAVLLAQPASALADIDASGSWSVYYIPALGGSAVSELWEFSQAGTSLTVSIGGGAPGTGTIDVDTGAFSVDFGPAPGSCGLFARYTLSGQVTADGATLQGSNVELFGGMCTPLAGTGIGTRCLNDPLGVLADCVTPEGPLFGRLLVVRDKLDDPTKRKVSLKLLDAGFVPPAASSLEDPRGTAFNSFLRPLLGGARLTIARGTAEQAVLELPAAGWRGLGNPAGSSGWLYVDPGLDLGPCKRALVKAGLIKVLCKDAGVGFTLDEASQGALTASLELGRVQRPPCSYFGGTVVRDKQTTPGKTGLFKAKNAGAPAACAGP